MSDADLVRLLQGDVDFTSLMREKHVFLDETSLRTVRDIELRLLTGPTVDPLQTGQQFTGIADLRLYLNGRDYTEQLRRQLTERVSELDSALIARGYRSGFAAYSRMADRLHISPEQRAHDQQYVENVLSNRDWASVFETLGNRREAGWSGNAHILNFLYSSIPIRPVSILQMLRMENDVPDFASWYQSQEHDQLSITFSSGPAPSFEDFEADFWPAGRLSFHISVVAHNPLEARLREIRSKVGILISLTESMRLNYLDPLKVEVEQLQGEVNGNAHALSSAIDEVRSLIESLD